MNYKELSNYDINCEVALTRGYSAQWINRHSDNVPDYCDNGRFRDDMIRYLEVREK